jgi:ribonuclease HII
MVDSTSSPRTVLAGIDEAGFGPILGPLVASSSVFRVPDNLIWADLWEFLRKSVGDKRTGLQGRLLIADSKKAYTRSVGIRHLRRTILAALKHLGKEPQLAGELVSALYPDCLERLWEYPWYQRLDDCPLGAEDASIGIGASMLAADLAANDMELLGLKSQCLEVAHYNRLVSAVRNKAKVLFTATAQLIQSVMDEFVKEDLEIVIDRQGGRSHYRRELQLMFGQMTLRVIREDLKRSSYELADAGHRVRVHFVVGADDKYLPVALASMASKYLREVLVDNINRYFTGLSTAVKPTAGYWRDGLRFINDIKTHIPQLNFDANQLIRLR